MALQGVMRYDQGNTHKKFSSIHGRRASLDGDQLGNRHRHRVVNSPIQGLPAKIDERIRRNDSSNYKEKQQQLRKSVWDCDSSLYDSFELHSFSLQLNRAIAAASSTPSSLFNSHQLVGQVRSWSMPHNVSTKCTTNSTECKYSTVNIEEINVVEEKLSSKDVEGNTPQITLRDRDQTVAQNDVKKMGFPRSVRRLFRKLINTNAGSCKSRNLMETEAVDRYCYKSVHPKKQEERYNEHSRGLSTHISEFDGKVRTTASQGLGSEFHAHTCHDPVFLL